MNVKINTSHPLRTIAGYENTWKQLDPVHQFEYAFFEKEFAQCQSHTDDRRFIGFLSIMALTIAYLGLLGMVTFTVETRTKEVGIRKVMGASIWHIILLLSRDFCKLLGMAALVSLPIGYWSGSQLLNEFAYRVSIGANTLLFGLMVMLVLGLITIGSQTFKAASANPVKSLRNE